MPTPIPRIVASRRTLAVLCALVVSLFFATFSSAAESTKTYSINSGPAATTLKQFADQSGRSVLFSTEKVQGISTNAISGELTTEEALDRLLSGTRLSAVPEKSTGGFAIRREVSVEVAEKNDSSRPANSRAADNVQDGVVKLDTFEVFGKKTLNMDIQRTRDDVQPYVTFDRQTLEDSGAISLEDFLRTRLPIIGAFQLNRIPAEFFFFPEGDHDLVRPNERLAMMTATVDWFSFWLKGEVPSDPDRAARWAILRQQQDEVLKTPPPPKGKWVFQPDPVQPEWHPPAETKQEEPKPEPTGAKKN